MLYDYSKLRGRIVEKFNTQNEFAAALSMPMETLSKKLNNILFWKQNEIVKAAELLEIPVLNIGEYFFKLKVQYD